MSDGVTGGIPEHPVHAAKRELVSAQEHLRVRCTGHAKHTNQDACDHVGAAMVLIDGIFEWERKYIRTTEKPSGEAPT